jgi:hypothetical protein
VLEEVRREQPRVSSEVKVTADEISNSVLQDVLKPDAIERDEADQARRQMARAATKLQRLRRAEAEGSLISAPPEGQHENQ